MLIRISKAHHIYHGDVMEMLHQIPDHSIDLIFLDPPYNLGKDFGQCKDQWQSPEEYMQWCYQWLALCLQKLSPTGSIYCMAATQFMPYFDLYLREHVHILSRIVWRYDSSGRQAKKYFGSLYEPILYGVKNHRKYVFNAHQIQVPAKTGAERKLMDYRANPPRTYNATKVPGNVWEFSRVRFRMKEYSPHPSQKPEALLERIVLASSHPGQTVLDPFAGTFTTAAVCARLDRCSISIEQEAEYVHRGQQRITEILNKKRKNA